MDGKGWKPEYGITFEGKRVLGFIEALPKHAREGLLTTVEMFCRSQGYVSLHDSLALSAEEKQQSQESGSGQMAQVIPILRARRKLG